MLTSYLVIFVLIIAFYTIYKELLRPSLALLGVVIIFTVSGIISADKILAGFSNSSIASVVLLILITTGLRKNFDVEYYLDRNFRSARSYRQFLFKMMTQVSLLSSVVNNTPVVALMTPYVFNWGKRNNIAPSKLLIPLSYATIMGGMITMIGTSTTLVLQGFLVDYELPGLSTFYLLIIGAAVTSTGILFIVLLGHKLLPDHRDLIDRFENNTREFLAETVLSPNSPLIGKSVTKAGMRNLKGVYLVEIIRKDENIHPVDPKEIIEPDDILIFAGKTEDIVDLVNSRNGIELPGQAQKLNTESIDVVEAVMANSSSLLGKKVKDTNFRNRYDAAIIAIHRNGEQISGKIGEVELKLGDLLLLYCGPEFEERTSLYRDIFSVTKLREFNRPSAYKRWSLAALALLAVGFLIVGFVPLFTSLLAIFSVMIALGFITMQDVKRDLDLNLIAILVFSLVIGEAIIQTDTGELVATQIIGLLKPYGLIPILVGLLVLTTILSSFITNVGAVSIAFPLAFAISNQLQVDGAPFYLAIAYAASAAFLTPIGYQTNLIVYGPGGYNFKDFFKIGFPVTILYLIVVCTSVILLYPEVFGS